MSTVKKKVSQNWLTLKILVFKLVRGVLKAYAYFNFASFAAAI